MLPRRTLLALSDDGGRDGRDRMELARRAIRTLRGRARNRTGNFLFRPAHRRGASGRQCASRRCKVKLVHGIHAMLVTPFTTDYKINEEALREEVRWALDNGADGIVATPSIGEVLHLRGDARPPAVDVAMGGTR